MTKEIDTSLTPEQVGWENRRALETAGLIHSGASYNQFGRLVITKNQLLTLENHNRNEIVPEALSLGEPLHIAISPDMVGDGIQHTRITRALYREGVRTPRDVLVLGSKWCGGVRTLGRQSVEIFQRIFSGQPDIEWIANPTPADIAAFCDNLRLVTGLVVAERFERSVIGQDKSELPPVPSVVDIFQMNEADLAKVVRREGWRPYVESDVMMNELRLEEARAVKTRAEEFVAAFQAAKTAQS
jgi:hypothetical protein